jgi:hypothetical protein
MRTIFLVSGEATTGYDVYPEEGEEEAWMAKFLDCRALLVVPFTLLFKTTKPESREDLLDESYFLWRA